MSSTISRVSLGSPSLRIRPSPSSRRRLSRTTGRRSRPRRRALLSLSVPRFLPFLVFLPRLGLPCPASTRFLPSLVLRSPSLPASPGRLLPLALWSPSRRVLRFSPLRSSRPRPLLLAVAMEEATTRSPSRRFLRPILWRLSPLRLRPASRWSPSLLLPP